MATTTSPPLQLASASRPHASASGGGGGGGVLLAGGSGGGVAPGWGRGRLQRRVSARSVASDRDVQGPVSPAEGLPSVLNSIGSSAIASNIKHHAEFAPLFSPDHFSPLKAYHATAKSVLDALLINWNATYDYYNKMNVKQAYYLSMEFLQGRALTNAIGNLEITGEYAEALKQLGQNLEDVASQEPDAALGNGGLGRLASCFLDSLATLNYPAWGYGLRYEYGLFKQIITKDGQEEIAENWLEMGYPWEVVRNDVSYPVKFYGKVVEGTDGRKHWIGGENIKAVAHDVPIPGYKTRTTNNLRLWSTTVPAQDFDLAAFNSGDHTKAYEAHLNAKKICHILYPGDESLEGKVLRLKQQYTLCSASLQDIIARFESRAGESLNWEDFPSKVAVQMNDTHPTLCIPELMRILMDVKGLSWSEAWSITERTVAYTNHTVLPEALEKWSLDIMQKLLPRHVEIIETIDEELINNIVSKYGTTDTELLKKKLKEMRILDNVDLPASISQLFVKPKDKKESPAKSKQKLLVKSLETIVDVEEKTELEEEAEVLSEIEEEKLESEEVEAEEESSEDELDPFVKSDPKLPRVVRMANLCVVGGHSVNGVAEIHSEIVKQDVFNSFYEMWPTKFQNKTNGVTPRRWIRFCNPALSALISKWIGSDDWVLNTDKLAELKKFADNEDLHSEWRAAKKANKMKVVSLIREKTGYIVSPDAMFDVQVYFVTEITTLGQPYGLVVKRIHEYKRQLLNILGIVYRYKKMKEMSTEERAKSFVPRAKRIVKFITDVAATVNHDSDIGDLLKVVFVPDYNVSVAEALIPASELSQHISTAGMEASGTSNMKFAMNGCILIGTLDGANVEIREEVGEENFFLFGAEAHEIAGLRKERAEGKFVPDPRFEEVKEFVRSGVFGTYSYDELMGSLEGNEGYGRADYFLVGKDFPSYIECQEKVDEAYRDQKLWTRMSILNTAGSSKFSSDRTIHEYAKDIWDISPAILP
ncbi:starch phosphorylase1 [Zea mays]|uniref:Alpha-1,4 glucan phosphorylase n=1 Tax=Zea mays TaxID=4577 RepID=A0A1D6L580_MAIZE|nr:starch phosphorylase1 [Zea mays]ONM09513.1 starch phosphorylase1 [Zea mays]